jgi:hypothetical protein
MNNDDIMRSVNNTPIVVAKNKNVDTASFVEDLDRLAGAYDGKVNYAQTHKSKNMSVKDMAYDEGQFKAEYI